MKFNLPEVAMQAADEDGLRVGNVYSARGGSKTAFWVVVALTEKGVACLGINRDGDVTSSATYGRHVFEGGPYRQGRAILGFVAGIEELAFDVSWGTL